MVAEACVCGMADGWEGCGGNGVAKEEEGFEPGCIECERFDKANPHTTMDLWRRAGKQEESRAGGKLSGVKLSGNAGVEGGKLLWRDCMMVWCAVVGKVEFAEVCGGEGFQWRRCTQRHCCLITTRIEF